MDSIFALLSARTADAMWLVDPQTLAVMDCNEAAVRLMRCPDKSALLGKSFRQLTPSQQADGTPSDSALASHIAATLAAGTSRFEWLLRCLDGGELPLEVSATQVAFDNEHPALVLVGRDVTQRKQTETALRESEARFRALFERSADAMSLFDPLTGRFTESNQAAAVQLGVPDREALRNLSPADLSPERQPDGQLSSEKARAMVQLALAEGSHRFEWLARGQDGSELPLDVVLTTLAYGDRLLLLTVTRDLTEQKQAERRIRQLNETLEQRVIERTTELLQANQQLRSEIAERQRAEARLRESEARARILVEHAPEAIVVFDGVTGRFVEVNDNAARLYGLSREELVGKHPAELSPGTQPDGRPSPEAAREKIQQALAGQTPVFEWMHRHTSGRLIPCEVRLLRLPGGPPDLIRGSVIDYTERRYREKIQRAVYEISEAVHRVEALDHLYEQIHQIVRSLLPAENFYIALLEPDGQRISFPYHVDELSPPPGSCAVEVGLTGYVLRLGKPLLVDDAMNARRRRVGQAVLFEGVSDILYVEKGVPAPIWLGVPLSTGGKTFGVMAVQDYHDPTAYGEPEKQLLSFVAGQISLAIERKRAEAELRASALRLKESEARFSTAFRLSPVLLGIARVRDRKYVEMNEAFLRWTGFTREEMIGRTSEEMAVWVHPEDRLRVWEELQRQGSLHDREVLLRNRAGAVHTLSISADLIDIENEPHVLMVAQDVTQRKKVEEELLKSLEREKELGQLRSNFVSMVSHEFRTPLGIIQSSAEILDDYFEQLAPEERREHLRSVHKNTRRMAGLMEEVLLISRFEAGKMAFQPQPLDLAAFAARLADEILSATDHKCPIQLSCSDIAGPAKADERLLRHIFTNLLTNAVKYSEPGQAVRFELRRQERDLVAKIVDRGIGIHEADREWLFKAFHRGRNVGERPGTGLGLFIVRRCLELHQGRFRVESKIGQGTTVTVQLPLFLP